VVGDWNYFHLPPSSFILKNPSLTPDAIRRGDWWLVIGDWWLELLPPSSFILKNPSLTPDP